MNEKNDAILREVNNYYSKKIKEYGPTPQGVDWNSKESQITRFNLLLKVCDRTKHFTIIDYGCGYGALAEYMTQQNLKYSYIGYDISSKMVEKAKIRFTNQENMVFTSSQDELPISDYVVASGIFNVKRQFSESAWKTHVEKTIFHMASLSRKGFGFNVLTSFSDKEFQREDLYYAKPEYYLDFCIRNFSRNVTLFHHYDLFEFSLLVYLDLEHQPSDNQIE
ncbi:MAG: class I SAM-dependent methyltransferase [Anaerolineales bacterium]|jgi:SAM-dependent methyltransferase